MTETEYNAFVRYLRNARTSTQEQVYESGAVRDFDDLSASDRRNYEEAK